MSRPDHPGVIAPPPLIFLAGLVLGLGADWAFAAPQFALAEPWRLVLPGALAVAGLGLDLWAALAFREAKTDVRPWKPTSAIAPTGPYRFTRNPMYLGMALVYLAVTLFTGSYLAVGLLIPALFAIQFGVIAREERYLEGKFGEEYRAYKARVRRWI